MNRSSILVEAAVENLDEAAAAVRAGVDRLELCADLSVGGTTPDAELLASVVERVRIPVFVMIRPRGGDFVYSAPEFQTMLRDIERVRAAEPDGLVTGALDRNSRIDTGQMRKLLDAAAGLPVTFHRAFDSIAEQSAALEELIDLGVARVLTSGGDPTALDGVERLAALIEQAAERITILAGGKIRDHNVREIIARTGVREVHARFVSEPQMRSLVDAVRGASPTATN